MVARRRGTPVALLTFLSLWTVYVVGKESGKRTNKTPAGDHFAPQSRAAGGFGTASKLPPLLSEDPRPDTSRQLLNGIDTNLQPGATPLSASTQSWLRLKWKLARGRPITVVGIGSSVLGVHGGCTGPAPQFRHLCSRCCYPRGNSTATGSMDGDEGWPGAGWARMGFDFLLAKVAGLGGQAASQSSALYNYARPGGSIEIFNRCLHKWAPLAAEADLVLMEFNVIAMDGAGSPEAKSRNAGEVEGLLRQLLSVRFPPAAMMVSFFQWCKDVPALCSSNPVAEQALSQMFSGAGEMDDLIRQLCQHYHIPLVSHLRSLWHIYFPGLPIQQAASQPLGRASISPQPLFTGGPSSAAHFSDGIHPTRAGNRVFGPLLVAALNETLAAAGRLPSSSSALGRPTAPLSDSPTLFGHNYKVPLSGSCFDMVRPDLKSLDSPGSPPQIAAVGGTDLNLLIPDSFANPPNIVRSRGFSYQEMVPAADGSLRWKPGVIASVAGSFLEMSHRLPGGRGGSDAPAEACMTYLRSYTDMGVGLFSCGGGCACDLQPVDALSAERSSVEVMHCFALRRRGAPPGQPATRNCTIMLHVRQGKEANQRDRFKLTSVAFFGPQNR